MLNLWTARSELAVWYYKNIDVELPHLMLVISIEFFHNSDSEILKSLKWYYHHMTNLFRIILQ